MNSRILLNRIKTPDGTILTSRHRHDYVDHIDKISGETYVVDGGLDYLKRSINEVEYEELSVYETDDFEKIRNEVEWGSYGKEPGPDRKRTYIKIKDLTDNHIKNIINDLMIGAGSYKDSTAIVILLHRELNYRRKNGISLCED